jgi:hypothetical protein
MVAMWWAFPLLVTSTLLRLPSIPQITETLEKVEKGLSALKSSPEGMDSLQVDLKAAIAKLKGDTATDEQKRLVAGHVQQEIEAFKNVLVAKQEELAAQAKSASQLASMKASGSVAADESDLFKALMGLQDAPLAEQLAVVNSSEFRELPIAARLMNESNKDGANLALEVGTELDHGGPEDKPTTPKMQLAAISGSLSARANRLKAEIAAMDKKEASRQAEAQAGEKGASLGAAETGAMDKAAKALKFFDKAAHRRFLKARTTKVAEEKDLDEAVAAIKKGDVKKVGQILKDMQALDPHPLV